MERRGALLPTYEQTTISFYSFHQNNVACNFTSIINFIQGYEGACIAHSLFMFFSWVDYLNHAVPSASLLFTSLSLLNILHRRFA